MKEILLFHGDVACWQTSQTSPISHILKSKIKPTRFFRKFVLSLLFFGMSFYAYSQGFTQITSNNCVSTGVDTLNFSLSSVPVPGGPGTIKFLYQGDLDGGVSGNEYFELIDEDGDSIGVSNCTGDCTTSGGQCLSTQDTVTFTVPLSKLQTWISDNTIDFKVFRGSGVSQTLCTSPGSCAQIILEYPPVSGPDDAGAAFIDPISTVQCPSSLPVSATIRNYGTNQITSLTVNWSVDGVTQTPVSFTGTLDTTGGSGSATASVALGNYSFSNGNFRIKAWTSGPNGNADTITVNDSAMATVSPVEAPTGLSASNITSTSADISWSSTGPTSFTIFYGLPGFNPSISGQTTTSTSAQTTLSSLNSNTEYDVYVLGDCGSGQLTDTAGPITFQTLCAVQTTPYTETFDNTTIPSCWETYSTSGELWTFGSNSYAPSSDHTGNSGEYATVDDSESPSSSDVTLETPRFDVSNLTNPELEFWLASQDATVTLTVDVWDGTNWNTGVYTHNTATINTTWEKISVNLTPYSSGDTIAVRFVVDENNGTFQNDIAIDDVSIQSGPACPDPAGLSVSGLTDSSAVLNWATGAPQAKVWFGPTGFFQGSQTPPGSGNYTIVSADSLFLDTLAANTCYEFGVLAYCTATDSSVWVGPFSFCTPCQGRTAPYTENFDGTSSPAINPCWTVVNQTGGSSTLETYSATLPSAFSAPNSVDFYTGSANSGDMILVSPLFNDMDQNKLVRFQFYNYNFDNADVYIGTLSNPSDPSTFTPYDTIEYGTYPLDQWIEYRHLFKNYTGNDQYIGIKAEMGNTFDQFNIDNFEYLNVTCPYPDNLVFTGNTSSSISLSWTSGGASNWQLEYGPVGFAPGNGTLVNVTSNPYTITSLSSGKVYDVYVRDSCGASDLSLWTGPTVANTSCNPLSGTYSIGGATPDFATFAEAAEALNVCGVSGPVTMNVQAGTYTDHFHLNGIVGISSGVSGLSATNTLTINGNGAKLVWDNMGPQATVLLDNSGHVTIDDMTIENSASSEGWGVLLSGDADSVTISNCTVIVDSSGNFGSDLIPILVSNDYENDLSAGADVDYLTITNSEIIGGYYGIQLYGESSTTFSENFVIEDNMIRNYYLSALYTYYIDGIKIIGNTMTSPVSATDEDGMYLYDNIDFTIEENVINVKDYGIYMNDANDGASLGAPSTIINNMISSENDYGMYLNDIEQINIFHNTVYGEPGFRFNDDETLNIQNNIFVSDADYAFESDDALDATTLVDYNLYFRNSAGDPFDISTSTYTDLAAWQTADASRNVNSVEGDPIFIAANDLHVIGGLADDAGNDTLGVTIDIDGDARPASGASSVDIGADEYTAVSGDLAVINGDFRKGLCLTNTDSVEIWIENLIGGTADFSNDPLTVSYNVTGPNNTSGSVTVNSGTLPAGDTLVVFGTNIDLSTPGNYILNAYIDSNGVNSLSFNDSLSPAVDIDVDSSFVTDPSVVTLASATDSVEICAISSFFGSGTDFKFTEIRHFDATGAGPQPTYLTADDYIEITGVPGSDLGGITLEVYDAGGVAIQYTFPSGTLIGPNGTALIMHGQGAGPSQPANFMYDGRGTYTGLWSSGTDVGYVLKDGNTVIDAVTYDAFTFPSSSGVSSSDWSGQVTGTSGTAGIRLTGPDNNSASDWTVVSTTVTQDPQVLNSGVPLPVAQSNAGFTWTFNGSTIDTNACTKVGGYSAPGTYVYYANYINPCGTFVDSTIVIVPSCLPPSNLKAQSLSTSSAQVSWDTTGLGGSGTYDLQYGPAGFTPGNGTIVSTTDSVQTLTGLTQNLCQDVYVRSACGPNDSSQWIGPVSVCPEEIICTDDFEQYSVGPVAEQSSLIIPWQMNIGSAGDAAVSTTRASSGNQSMRITDKGPSALTDVVAYFDTISSGIWQMEWNMYVESGDGAYFNVQQNHDLTGANNLWLCNLVFDANGTVTAAVGGATTPTLGTFSYSPGQWFKMSTIIDITNDSVWFEINSTSTGIGFVMSSNGLPLQFNGVDFYAESTLPGSYSHDYYVDDFCVKPYQFAGCQAPTSVTASQIGCDSLELSWNSFGSDSTNRSIIEYGPAGFTPGNGTYISFVNSSQMITGLTLGTSYDFYVADTCGANDTSDFTGPETFMTLSGPQPVASFTANVNGYTVNFDGSASANGNSYDWDFGDGNTGSGMNTTHTYSTGGTMTIILTVSNTCGTDDTTIVLNDINLIENELENGLTLFPNPTSQKVTLSTDGLGNQDISIQITDLSGKNIMKIEGQSVNGAYEQTLDVSHLADGVYMIKVTSGNLKATRRLIKK